MGATLTVARSTPGSEKHIARLFAESDYTQWERREDFEAMVPNPAVAPYFGPIGEVTTGEQKAYDVVYSH